MKKLKNNKGITGVDITASMVILMIAIGIISSMYSKYINNSKQIKRNTEANNLAMDFIEYIEKTDFNTINDLFYEDKNQNDKLEEDERIYTIEIKSEDDIVKIFGVKEVAEVPQIPSSYSVILNKQEDERKIDEIAMKINVEVSYKVDSKEKKVSLSTIKTTLVNQVNPPDMEAEQVKKSSKNNEYIRYALKYSNLKEGYIQGKTSDDDWYSISAKRYPVVVYAKKEAFDINGVIDFNSESNGEKNVSDIYIWVPRFGKLDDNNYGFCYDITDNMIVHGDTGKTVYDTTDKTTYKIKGYTVNESKSLTNIPSDFLGLTGKWVRVNANLESIGDSEILNILKTQSFIWE